MSTDVRKESLQKLKEWQLLEELLEKGSVEIRGIDRLGHMQGGHAVHGLRNALARALGDGINADPTGVSYEGWLSSDSPSATATVSLSDEARIRLRRNYRDVSLKPPMEKEGPREGPARPLRKEGRPEEWVAPRAPRAEYIPTKSNPESPDMVFLIGEERNFLKGVENIRAVEGMLSKLGLTLEDAARVLRPGMPQKERLAAAYPAAAENIRQVTGELSTIFDDARDRLARFGMEHEKIMAEYDKLEQKSFNPFKFLFAYQRMEELRMADRGLHLQTRETMAEYTRSVEKLFDSVKAHYRNVRELEKASDRSPVTVPVYCTEFPGNIFYVSVPFTNGPVGRLVATEVGKAVSAAAPETSSESNALHVTYKIIEGGLDMDALARELRSSRGLAELSSGLKVNIGLVHRKAE